MHNSNVLYQDAGSLELINAIYNSNHVPEDATPRQNSIYHEPLPLSTPDRLPVWEDHYEMASPYEQPVTSTSVTTTTADFGDYAQPFEASGTKVLHLTSEGI